MKENRNVAVMIGLGACGSAITELAQTVGLAKGFILNSAVEDLDAIKGIDAASKWKLNGISGAAKNRKAAQDAFKNDYKPFLEAVRTRLLTPTTGEALEDVDVMFVVASAGGGTGSGILPAAARMLQKAFPTIQVVPIVVWPSADERGIAQQNCVDCTRELLSGSGSGFPTILIDNTRVDDEMILGKYDKINRETVENIKSLLNCDKSSRISNIDSADRLSMFKDPGLLVIGSATVNLHGENPLVDAIQQAITTTPATANIAGVVKKVAVQLECDASLYTSKAKSEITQLFPNALGFFDGYYSPVEALGNTEESRVLIAFSGASLNDKAFAERAKSASVAFNNERRSEAAVMSKGNVALKNAWATTKAPATEEGIKVEDESMDDIFDEISDL